MINRPARSHPIPIDRIGLGPPTSLALSFPYNPPPSAKASDLHIEKGHELMEFFLRGGR